MSNLMDEKKIQKLLNKADRICQLNRDENNFQEKIDIYHQAGQACRSIGNYDKAIKYFNLELHQSQLANLHDDILYCYRFLGECYSYKNKFSISEKYLVKFLSLAKEYNNDERIEQAYTCLANTYWIWLSYLQDDILYDSIYDQLPRNLCQRSLDAAKNSLLIIEKLDYQLNIDIKEKYIIKLKDIEYKQKDLALRRVRSYINIANVISENYINGEKDNANLQTFSQYIKNAIELSKKYNLYEELTRLYSSLSFFYLEIPNYLQYKKEIILTMKQAIYYAKLTKNINEYLSCLYDIAQTLVSFDDYEEAKIHLLKISRYKKTDNIITEKATEDLMNVQRILTGVENRYKNEINLRKKMSLAEKCADTFSNLNRNEQSKNYYLKQLKHAKELNLNQQQMATIYSSLGSIYQDLKEWQLSIDYFRREMSCRIGLNINADIEQGYSLCEIIKCEYRLKIDLNLRIKTFKRLLTIARSINEKNLIRMAIAVVFAMKLRDSRIYLNDDLEEFMANIQPPITEENYSEILRNENIENENAITKCEKIELDDMNLPDYHNWTHISSDDDRKLNHTIDCTQSIIENDSDNEEIILTNIPINHNMITNKRLYHKKKNNKFSIAKCNRWNIEGEGEMMTKTQSKRLHSLSDISTRKRRCTMIDNESCSSNDIEILSINDSDFLIPFQKELHHSSRSRQVSTTSSIDTTIVLSSPIIHDTNPRIIRCLANTTVRTTEDKKLRIPISPSDTITNLRYQVLKRLYDNYNIYACFVTLYDRQDWELGMSESDTIQLAIPIDESDIKAIYIEKDPVIIYKQICNEMNLIIYSNIRSILRLFFNKFELSLQRLSLKLEQTISILKIFENFMFIYSINLSENNLTDEIFDQLGKLTLDQLKILNLSKNKFTSFGIRKLFEEKIMNNLLVLDLSSNIDIDCITLIFLRTHFPSLTVYH